MVVVRLLGGEQAWREGLAALRDQARGRWSWSAASRPDAALMALSTVPAGVAAQAHDYLAHGGTANLRELATVPDRHRAARRHRLRAAAARRRLGHPRPLGRQPPDLAEPGRAGAPVVGIVYYRAHELAGNTGFVDAAVPPRSPSRAPGRCRSGAAACARPSPSLLDVLGQRRRLIVTVLAAGGSAAALAQAGGDDEAWDAGAIAALDVPVLQALCLTAPARGSGPTADAGLSPLDAATQVAIPEFDGRLISVPFSFKETGDDGLSRLRRRSRARGHGSPGTARGAGPAAARRRPAQRRVALVLSSYPTKHARIGNAVGLDTPASAVALLRAMRAAGLRHRPADRRRRAARHRAAGRRRADPRDHRGRRPGPGLADRASSCPRRVVRIPAARYRGVVRPSCPPRLRASMEQAWGPPPGELYVDRSRDPDGEIVLAALTAGNVVLLVQPPRGFGENPIAIYHDPDLPPSHHYLAAYRWLERGFGAHAVVHLGKHGTLEWLPGKNLGHVGRVRAPTRCSATCR